MCDCGLRVWKHGKFLSEQNILLVSCEWAGEEGLCETEFVNVRMCEGGVAEHALWNGDVIAAKECFVASSAGMPCTRPEWAENGFAIGCIECVAADGTSRVGHI